MKRIIRKGEYCVDGRREEDRIRDQRQDPADSNCLSSIIHQTAVRAVSRLNFEKAREGER